LYHSITFLYGTDFKNSKNTWTHFHLIPSSRPVVSRPTPVYKYVDIPGMNGSLDLTNYLVGKPTYSDRSGSFTFYVANGYGKWADREMELADFFDGAKEMRMELEDDPHYYYIGRFYLKQWNPGTSNSEVTIEYRVKPDKYSKGDTYVNPLTVLGL